MCFPGFLNLHMQIEMGRGMEKPGYQRVSIFGYFEFAYANPDGSVREG
jgi:hypothetical protein